MKSQGVNKTFKVDCYGYHPQHTHTHTIIGKTKFKFYWYKATFFNLSVAFQKGGQNRISIRKKQQHLLQRCNSFLASSQQMSYLGRKYKLIENSRYRYRLSAHKACVGTCACISKKREKKRFRKGITKWEFYFIASCFLICSIISKIKKSLLGSCCHFLYYIFKDII